LHAYQNNETTTRNRPLKSYKLDNIKPLVLLSKEGALVKGIVSDCRSSSAVSFSSPIVVCVDDILAEKLKMPKANHY
jgi:hypothetical protein